MIYYPLTSALITNFLYTVEGSIAELSYKLASSIDYGECDDSLHSRLNELRPIYRYFSNLDLNDYDATKAATLFDRALTLMELAYSDVANAVSDLGSTILDSNCGCSGVSSSFDEATINALTPFSVDAANTDPYAVQPNDTLYFLPEFGSDITTRIDDNRIYIGAGRQVNQATRILTGGQVTYSGSGLTYNVAPATYLIGGVNYSYPGGQVTLNPGDSDDRFDAVVFDTSGSATVIQGSPSTDVLYPYVDPTLYAHTQFIKVAANSTSNSNYQVVSQVYDENLGQPLEWNTVETVFGDADSTVRSFKNTKSIEGDNTSQGAFYYMPAYFSSLTFFQQSDITHVEFRVYLEAGCNVTGMEVFLSDTVTYNMVHWVINNGSYGFDAQSTDEWQHIVLPLNQANIYSSADFRRIYMYFFATAPVIGKTYVDDVQLIEDTSLAPPTTTTYDIFKFVEADDGNTLSAVGSNDKLYITGDGTYIETILADSETISIEWIGPDPDSNLREVGEASLTAPDSVYTMTSGIPVKWLTSAGAELLHLDEATRRIGITVTDPDDVLDLGANNLVVRTNNHGIKILGPINNTALLFQNESERIMRMLNYTDSWTDDFRSGFFQFGMTGGFFSGNNGDPLVRFGISSAATMVTWRQYDNMRIPQSRMDIEGNLTVGATYAGNHAAPVSGAIFEGSVGIGTTTVDTALHVVGNPKFVTGAEADGYIWVSDTNGVGEWTDPATLGLGGGGITWTEVSTNTSLAVNTGYITNGLSTLTHTLPASSVVGDVLEIAGKDGGWILSQNAGQYIIFGIEQTTTGVGGNLSSTDNSDCVRLVCIIADTAWLVLSSVGNIDVN